MGTASTVVRGIRALVYFQRYLTIYPAHSAIAFAYVERILKARNQTLAVAKALSLLDSMLPVLEASGFQRMVFEDFYDVLASLIRQIVIPEEGGTVLTLEILLEAFQSPEGEANLIEI